MYSIKCRRIYKEHRKKKDKTQKEIANMLGISESTYYRIEQNKIGVSADKAFKLAQYFDFEMKEKITYTEDLKMYISCRYTN